MVAALAMSEFKFACPVCKQHMMCDTLQGGSVMECPTCFQKVIAPQAPAADSKYILTGTKVSEKKNVFRVLGLPRASASVEKTIPLKDFIFILAVCLVAEAGLFLLYISHKTPGTPQTLPQPVHAVVAKRTPAPSPQPEPTPLPQPAQPVNPATWLPDLSAATIPNSQAAGQIHELDFTVTRSVFWDGSLTMRTVERGPLLFGISIGFPGMQAEALAGKSINITTNADQAAAVSMRWLDDDQQQKESFTNHYAMRLEFGQLRGNTMPGKIYLCLPDEEHSYIAGTINVEIYKPKPAAQPTSPQSSTTPTGSRRNRKK